MPDRELIDSFVSEELAVSTVCQILQIPRGSYYRARMGPIAWQRAESKQDREVLEHIKEINLRFPAWGYRCVRALLTKRLKIRLNRKRIYRLM
jgi:hypothetical protein